MEWLAPLLHMYGEHVVNAHMATSMLANWAYVHAGRNDRQIYDLVRLKSHQNNTQDNILTEYQYIVT